MSWQTIVQTIFGQRYYEVHVFQPFTITVSSTAQALSTQDKWCLGYVLRVRSMSTATYVGVGDRWNREFRLTSMGESFGWSGNPREVMKLDDVWVSCDAGSPVIEVYSIYKEGQEGEDYAVDT